MNHEQEAEQTGPDYFDTLQAEQEASWLASVFVNLPEFRPLAGMRSIVVFGEPGAGKSALCVMLAQTAERGPQPARLVVRWQPRPETGDTTGAQARAYQDQLLAACATALLRALGRLPHAAASADEWTRDTIAGVLHAALGDERERAVRRVAHEATPEGITLLRSLLQRPPVELVPPGEEPIAILPELILLARQLGLGDGVWVLVDGFDHNWHGIDLQRHAETLALLLNALAPFEVPRLAIKLLMPASIAPLMPPHCGVDRRRLDAYALNWTPDRLVQVIERRVAEQLGRPGLTLSALGPAGLRNWLVRCGGSTPRSWLSAIAPIVAAFAERAGARPLTLRDCALALGRRPPMLQVTPDGHVYLGEARVPAVPPRSLKVLSYLYAARRLCSREELYYLGYRGIAAIPRMPGDQGYEDPATWRDVLDNIIHELRRVLEIDPKTPVYVLTDKRRGVQLQHFW